MLRCSATAAALRPFLGRCGLACECMCKQKRRKKEEGREGGGLSFFSSFLLDRRSLLFSLLLTSEAKRRREEVIPSSFFPNHQGRRKVLKKINVLSVYVVKRRGKAAVARAHGALGRLNPNWNVSCFQGMWDIYISPGLCSLRCRRQI